MHFRGAILSNHGKAYARVQVIVAIPRSTSTRSEGGDVQVAVTFQPLQRAHGSLARLRKWRIENDHESNRYAGIVRPPRRRSQCQLRASFGNPPVNRRAVCQVRMIFIAARRQRWLSRAACSRRRAHSRSTASAKSAATLSLRGHTRGDPWPACSAIQPTFWLRAQQARDLWDDSIEQRYRNELDSYPTAPDRGNDMSQSGSDNKTGLLSAGPCV